MGVKGFNCYATYYELAKCLPTEKEQGQFWVAVMDYMFADKDTEDSLDPFVRMAFVSAKGHLRVSKANSQNGQKGNAMRWENGESVANESQNCRESIANASRNCRENIGGDKVGLSQDKDKDKVQDKDKDKGRFTPPTVQEVKDYINEKGFHFDAQEFVDYYGSRGWKRGKTKMSNWKLACNTWERKENEWRCEDDFSEFNDFFESATVVCN